MDYLHRISHYARNLKQACNADHELAIKRVMKVYSASLTEVQACAISLRQAQHVIAVEAFQNNWSELKEIFSDRCQMVGDIYSTLNAILHGQELDYCTNTPYKQRRKNINLPTGKQVDGSIVNSESEGRASSNDIMHLRQKLSQLITDYTRFEDILDGINYINSLLFITGQSGTGKSALINQHYRLSFGSGLAVGFRPCDEGYAKGWMHTRTCDPIKEAITSSNVKIIIIDEADVYLRSDPELYEIICSAITETEKTIILAGQSLTDYFAKAQQQGVTSTLISTKAQYGDYTQLPLGLEQTCKNVLKWVGVICTGPETFDPRPLVSPNSYLN